MPHCDCEHCERRFSNPRDLNTLARTSLCRECLAGCLERGATMEGRYRPHDACDDTRIICPKCGDSWEPDSGTRSQGWHDETCPTCGAAFVLEVEVTTTYTTRLAGDAAQAGEV